MDQRTTKKEQGPRLRVITLRVERGVYYRLKDLAESQGLSLYELVYRKVVSSPSDQEVAE